MNAVHLASSRQVHLSFNGVIVDVGTHATRQFLCPPIEIRFATLVAAAQPIFDCPPQAFPDGNRQRHRADRSRRRAAGGRPRRRRDDAQPQATSPRRRSRHPRRRRADVTVTTTGQATLRERTALAGHSHHCPFGIREELPERTAAPPPGYRRGPRRGGENGRAHAGALACSGVRSVIDGTGHDDRRAAAGSRALPVGGDDSACPEERRADAFACAAVP